MLASENYTSYHSLLKVRLLSAHTVDDDILPLVVLVLEGRDPAGVLSAELRGWVEDGQGSVHGIIVVRHTVLQVHSTLQHTQVLRRSGCRL